MIDGVNPLNKPTGQSPFEVTMRAPQSKAAQPGAAQETAQEFEAMFLTQMVQEMIKTVDLGSFGGGNAEEKWRGFLAEAMADQIAEQGNTGIAQSIEKAITSYQSAARKG